MVSIIWKQRRYHIDCREVVPSRKSRARETREVARGTQSAYSCLCTYSTYDIAKSV